MASGNENCVNLALRNSCSLSRIRQQEEQFNVVRKVRLKGWQPSTARASTVQANVVPSYLSSTRYTVLRDLGDYPDHVTEEELVVKRERVVEIKSRTRVSPKKSSKISPRKHREESHSLGRRKNWRRWIGGSSEETSRRPRKSKKTSSWWACSRPLQIAALLLLLYFLLFHRGRFFGPVLLDELSLTH